MTLPAGNGFSIHLEQIPGLGSTWIVRLYRKKFLFRKLISSDWFLDEKQAERFAQKLATDLRLGKTPQ